jgi:hypothetical protein
MDMSTTSNEPKFFEVLEDTDSMKHILAPKTVYFSGEHSWKIALSALHLGRVAMVQSLLPHYQLCHRELFRPCQ